MHRYSTRSINFQQPEWIHVAQRIPADIGIGIDAAGQSYGVGWNVSADRGIVVSEVVVCELSSHLSNAQHPPLPAFLCEGNVNLRPVTASDYFGNKLRMAIRATEPIAVTPKHRGNRVYSA